MSSTIRWRAALVAIAVVCLPVAGFLAAVEVPTDIQQPGTQPSDNANLEAPSKCDNCHAGYDAAVEPYFNWSGSMMAQAGRDPLFWATVAVAERAFDGSGDLCLRCHAADGWLSGRSTPTDGSGLAQGDASGVACDLCHRMVDPDGSEHGGLQFSPFLAHDGDVPPEGWYGSGMYVIADFQGKLGPYDDSASPHAGVQSAFHRSSAFCGTCHDVSNPVVGDLAPGHGAHTALPEGSYSGVPGTPVTEKAAFLNPPAAYGITERTFSEHMASAFPTLSVADYSTLPPELQQGAIEVAWTAATAVNPEGNYADGTPRSFTCQTCHMPPVTGKGCNKANAPVRSDLPFHDMTGGNTWAGDAIQYLDASDDLVLGGGLSSTDVAALDAAKARAEATLQSAAGLSVAGNSVRVVNLTGHKLPTGFPEGRRMWLRTTWFDGFGQQIRVDGEYGALDVVLDGSPLQVETLLAPDDPRTVVYDTHPGMTAEWAVKLIGLGKPASLPLTYDRLTGLVETTLGDLAAMPPGSVFETFHFVLNDTVVSDMRIPPYGMRFDEALERNAVPVPMESYGDPGPGGVYEHWHDASLQPPGTAATATVELLYQATSWEYVQFLYLANDETSEFLGETGEHLLEAWLATGMSAPVVMASAPWFRDCNVNGVPDEDDVSMGASPDVNGNGVPDECETRGGLHPLPPTPPGQLTLILGGANGLTIIVGGLAPGGSAAILGGTGVRPSAGQPGSERLVSPFELNVVRADEQGRARLRIPRVEPGSAPFYVRAVALEDGSRSPVHAITWRP